MTELKLAEETLVNEAFTCVLMKGGALYTSKERGVNPLVELLESGEDFSGFFAADKVVGKATAFLYILLKVKAVYASVISKSALEVLEDNGIYTEFTTLTQNIINRQGNGICPFELSVLDINDPEIAYARIREKMREMNISLKDTPCGGS